MWNIKTTLLVIALVPALFFTFFIFSLNVVDIGVLRAIAVISALYGAISISSLILVHKIRKGKKKTSEIKILSAIAVISALLAVFLVSFIILIYMQLPDVPEKKPVFKIEDEAVKDDLIRRGLMSPNGTYLNLSGVEDLIKKGVYRIDPNGTLELAHNNMVSPGSEVNGDMGSL